MKVLLIVSIMILITIFFYIYNHISSKNNYEHFQNYENELFNIYNKPLEICKEKNMSNGSWDNNGKCSERGGGVHQICIRNIAKSTPNFSQNTGQSNWSNKRGTNNHCVCLGAWSLYNAQKKRTKNNVLKCNAIPKYALSEDYVSKFSEGWNKWNGLELNDQIKYGVESLINNCYKPDVYGMKTKSENLRKNYCNFAKNIETLKQSNLFKKLCNK